MSEAASFFIGQVELLVAVAFLLIVLKIGRVGMSFLIAIGVYVCRNIFDSFAKMQMIPMEAPLTEKIALWYSLFAITAVFSMIAVYLLHRIVQTPMGPAAKGFMRLSYLLACIQVFRCSERLFFDTAYLAKVYSIGIPTINYLMLTVFAVGLYKVYQRSKEFGERIEWSM